MNNQVITRYLEQLDLSPEEARIYVELVRRGASTPLHLARVTGINRTKVYRTLESLAQRKLAAQGLEEHSTLYSPAPVARIQELLKEKQGQIANLSSEWGAIETSFSQIEAEQQSDTRIKFYRGKSGLQQMVWNVLKAKSEIVGYTFRDLTDFVGDKFMSEFVSEFKRRKLAMRDIYGDEYRENKHVDNNWGNMMNSRYLSREILAIPHQMDIYDEVVSFYSWNEGEVWGTEIYNPRVAQMQKQLFELAWEKAKKKYVILKK